MTIANGLDIRTTIARLRRYVFVEQRCVKISAGWFLATPIYEWKYALGDHLWEHAEHTDWMRTRLSEMRGGHAEASVESSLRTLMEQALSAPDAPSLLRGVYGVIKRDLLRSYRLHLEQCDPVANAAEVRLLRRLIPEIEAQLVWYDSLQLDSVEDPWRDYIEDLLHATGGVDGAFETQQNVSRTAPTTAPFERPRTIVFDDRIQRHGLLPYEERQKLDSREATIEQFKIFFNEFYAAAVLASVIYDGFDDPLPWKFFHDFSHHFWDEARHSRFGAVRLKEFGIEPAICDPILYEQSEGMPILHRICYLTLGLEVLFMPRKEPRVREYERNGDARSQLFADQDWNDEITHVRYGRVWLDELLKDDFRTREDIQEEVREYLAKITGEKQSKVNAPF